MVIATLLSVATSAPRYRNPRSFPIWTMTDSAHQLGCATFEVWISKSGKTGVGVSMLASTSQPQCQVVVESINLEIAGESFAGEPLMAAPPVRPNESIHFYSPIAFDNESHWNNGKRDAVINVQFGVDGVRSPIRVSTSQQRKKPHDRIARHEPPNLTPLAETTVSPEGIVRTNAGPAQAAEPSEPSGPLAPVEPTKEPTQPSGPLEPVETTP